MKEVTSCLQLLNIPVDISFVNVVKEVKNANAINSLEFSRFIPNDSTKDHSGVLVTIFSTSRLRGKTLRFSVQQIRQFTVRRLQCIKCNNFNLVIVKCN